MKTKFSGILTLLLAFVVQLTFAQEKTISGTVSDGSGLPLPGTTVLVKGTTSGTSTDFDGNYSIQANTGATLVYSFVGYSTQEIVVGTSNTVNVKLTEDAESLEEVVITAQGIKAKPRSLSYAVETVGSDDITKAQETNMVSALSAKAAGVQVTTSSGSVGASANIRIRGNTSITRSNSPLFVVDGVPINNDSYAEDPTDSVNNSSLGGSDFSNRAIDINSADIESVNILKGIAAQTLYGLRAANGVVLITTKKGKEGKTRVSLTTSASFSEINGGPDLQRTYAQGRHAADGEWF